MLSWCCAHTHEYFEARAENSLTEKGFTVFAPYFTEERIVRNKPIAERKPLFPQYIFVQLDLDGAAWRRAANAKGVKQLLGANGEAGRPSVLRAEILYELAQRCDDDCNLIAVPSIAYEAVPIRVGSEVRVTQGPFEGFTGICQMSSKDRVTLLLHLFGRPTPVPLPRSQLAAVSA